MTSYRFTGGLPVWLAYRLYDEFRRADGGSPLTMEGLTLEILEEASRSPAGVREHKPPRWLRQVRELLHARRLRIEYVCRELYRSQTRSR